MADFSMEAQVISKIKLLIQLGFAHSLDLLGLAKGGDTGVRILVFYSE